MNEHKPDPFCINCAFIENDRVDGAHCSECISGSEYTSEEDLKKQMKEMEEEAEGQILQEKMDEVAKGNPSHPEHDSELYKVWQEAFKKSLDHTMKNSQKERRRYRRRCTGGRMCYCAPFEERDDG